MKHHPEILSIVYKYCDSGHSTIQEVDNLHSHIERVCKNCESYSPIGLLRMIIKVNKRKPMKVVQMKPEYFKDFQTIAKQS